MVFTETDPEYSVEDYLNAVTANLILNIGPEPINTPLHQNWIHIRTALIQTTLDGAAQKWFSVLPIDYLNAVTANLILNIGPEPINTPLHQNWIHRRTALIQTTLDGAAQKWFSVIPI